MWSSADHYYMRRALQLARRGRYTASPNPCVGCVIVRQGRIIGEGYHRRCGEPHAEVNAVAAACGQVQGATVYVTLEPCSHYGRTPPCAGLLAAQHVSEVVAAMEDPNPRVAGQGLALLREHGIKVRTGLLAVQAACLNRAFCKAITQHLPWVTVKLGMSLDAKVALSDGSSKWITGSRSRSRVQQLRARSDAVITSVRTVLADDPKLNVRYMELPAKLRKRCQPEELRQPLKVILDSRARLAGQLDAFQVFASDRILLVTAGKADGVPRSLSATTTLLNLASDTGQVDLRALLRYLGEQEVRSVLVEAGPVLASSFIDQGLCDELVCFVAPRLLGGSAREAFCTRDLEDLTQSSGLRLAKITRLGDDVCLRYVSQPSWGSAAA